MMNHEELLKKQNQQISKLLKNPWRINISDVFGEQNHKETKNMKLSEYLNALNGEQLISDARYLTLRENGLTKDQASSMKNSDIEKNDPRFYTTYPECEPTKLQLKYLRKVLGIDELDRDVNYFEIGRIITAHILKTEHDERLELALIAREEKKSRKISPEKSFSVNDEQPLF